MSFISSRLFFVQLGKYLRSGLSLPERSSPALHRHASTNHANVAILPRFAKVTTIYGYVPAFEAAKTRAFARIPAAINGWSDWLWSITLFALIVHSLFKGKRGYWWSTKSSVLRIGEFSAPSDNNDNNKLSEQEGGGGQRERRG